MVDPVQLTRDKDVAIITINNPPVNALSPAVPRGLPRPLSSWPKTTSVKAVVLIGGGRTFIAGADIKEFGKITSGKTPRGAGLLPLLLQIENCASRWWWPFMAPPSAAALSLPWPATTAWPRPTAQVGQPEVKLGIIPGAGGTQRLPRLVGVAKAVEMCAEGKPIQQREAARDSDSSTDLIDGDLLTGAVAFARESRRKPAPEDS